MRRIILILSSALCISIMAQTQTKVAVFVTGLDSTDAPTKKIIGNEIANGIVSMSDYSAEEQTEEFLNSVNAESGNINISDQKILDLAAQNGAKIACIVTIMPYQNTFYIQAKMQNAHNAKILSSARVSSSLGSLDEILSATENLTQNLMTQLNAKREEVKQRQQEQERLEQQKAQEEQDRKAIEQERKAQEQALEEQRMQEMLDRSQAQLSESLDQLGETINEYRRVKNSYILEVRNTTKNPFRVNLDGHILGVIGGYKVERYIVPIEWYGRLQVVQTSGYVLYATINDYQVPMQKKQALVKIVIK